MRSFSEGDFRLVLESEISKMKKTGEILGTVSKLSKVDESGDKID